jgi:hypothetical protein
VVSCDEIALREILLLEQYRAKAHLEGHHFLKILYENKPYQENLKLIYTKKISAGIPNLVRLSLYLHRLRIRTPVADKSLDKSESAQQCAIQYCYRYFWDSHG